MLVKSVNLPTLVNSLCRSSVDESRALKLVHRQQWVRGRSDIRRHQCV